MSATALRAAVSDHPSLRELVYRRIKDAILGGRLEPGERIVEQSLSNELGVSRSPVREALRRLEQEGLVEATPRRGVSVAAPTVREVTNVYTIREALEGLAARLAASNVDHESLAAMARILVRMEDAIRRGDIKGASRADTQFHARLLEATDNQRLVDLTSQLADLVRRVRAAVLAEPGRAEAALSEHRAILEALAAQDADAAERHMRAHVQRARDHMLRILTRRPESADTPTGQRRTGLVIRRRRLGAS
jgi:DNA-binding GntR family transcriptional regulator